MKVLWFLPLTFVAEVHGFAIFAPYLILFFFATLWLRRRRRQRPPVTARAIPAPALPEQAPLFALAAQPAL